MKFRKVKRFDWDERNIAHIAKHSVSLEEVEKVFLNNKPHFRRHGKVFYAFGQTSSGRYLFIVFRFVTPKVVRVITARDMTQKERRYYRRVTRR
ncbi:hypothetical protein B0813_001315 [Candidatus Fervidibacteria bacterium JGI MDM2 SSWTFF-3-K9]